MTAPITARRIVKMIGKVLYETLPPFLYRQVTKVVGRLDRHKRYVTKYPPLPRESFLVNNHDFIRDPQFIDALTFAFGDKEALYGSHHQWKFYNLPWAAQHAMALKADIVQCGVFVGTGAAAIFKYVDLEHFPERRLFLIDTFTGIPD